MESCRSNMYPESEPALAAPFLSGAAPGLAPERRVSKEGDHRTIDIYLYLASDSSQHHILTEGLAVLAPIIFRAMGEAITHAAKAKYYYYYYPGQKKRPLRLCIKSEHCSYHAISA